jgi:hypothetical protein
MELIIGLESRKQSIGVIESSEYRIGDIMVLFYI